MRTNPISGPTERPVIFSREMVKAILEDRKTQTRRIIKPQPYRFGERGLTTGHRNKSFSTIVGPTQELAALSEKMFCRDLATTSLCPYGLAGTVLWVRETWAADKDNWGNDNPAGRRPSKVGALWAYKADYDGYIGDLKWRPSIHMPRWASRITLEITRVRVERLQDISEEDAIAEGITWDASPRLAYKQLWESLHGGGAWDANPWVWVLDFKRHLTGNVTKSVNATSVSSPKTEGVCHNKQ